MSIDPIKQADLPFQTLPISNKSSSKKENFWQKFMPSFPNLKTPSPPLKEKITNFSINTLPTKKDLEDQPLFQRAIAYYKNNNFKDKVFTPFQDEDISDLDKQANDESSIEKLEKSLIEKLLKKSDGFCVGENHFETGGKYYLIKNMQTLYDNNVRVIGIEGLTIDDEILLNDCQNDPNNIKLQNRKEKLLKKLEDMKPAPKDKNCQVRHIVEAALEYNMRIIAISYDTNETFTETYNEKEGKNYYPDMRIQMMNYIAEKAVRQAQSILNHGEKFVCFMGEAHLSRNMLGGEGKKGSYLTPGIADLLQVPAITFRGNFLSNETEMTVKIQKIKKDSNLAISTPGVIEVNYAAKQAKNMGKLDIFSWFNKKNTVV